MPVAVCQICDDWKVFGDYEYAFNREQRTFHGAEQDCIKCGGQLVTLKDQGEFDLAQQILGEL